MTTKRIELVGKKEFAVAALDLEYETFVIHVASLFNASFSSILLNANIYPFCKPQIADLIAGKAFTKISNKYIDFADIFFPDLVSKLLRHTGINDYAIKLVDSQQPLYILIYSLRPIELETLKAYIETNLAIKFIKPSKSPTSIPILFDQKLNRSFQLYINYRGLNNLTINNQYPLPLVRESLNRLKKARRFT